MTYRRIKVTEDGQVTERFTRAIEQLGDERMAVRLGGIYALGRIAEDSNRDHRTVVEVLSAFVRDKTPRNPSSTDPFAPKKPLTPVGREADEPQDAAAALAEFFAEDDEGPIPEPEADVQAALTVLGRVGKPVTGPRIDLRATTLAKVDLREADFSEADLRGADLRQADFLRANFASADLQGADLRGVRFAGASFRGVRFHEALVNDEGSLKEAASLSRSKGTVRYAKTS